MIGRFVNTNPLGPIPFFAVALFASAFLLFALQPMFAKMVLPLLGGSPGVWNTAMLFFQTMLVAGYAYAHVVRSLKISQQIFAHFLILGLGFICLPISIVGGGSPPVDATPVLWLIGLFALSVGLPFFALSASAPLLQHWFARTKHSMSHDPYFLYSASNVGSILALLLYLFLIEPNFKLQEQSRIWAGGYIALLFLIAACALPLLTNQSHSKKPAKSEPPTAIVKKPVGWRDCIHWTVLAFVPSSLLLGVTAHITSEIAAVPLLWVLPLILYLLTFVITFARHPLLQHSWLVKAQPFFVIIIAVTLWGTINLSSLFILPHLLVFFVCAMVCHGELVRRRPIVDDLTIFYLWIAIGGMLGGVFNALLAPLLFNSVVEYPLALILASMLRPSLDPGSSSINARDFIYPLLLLLLFAIPSAAFFSDFINSENSGVLAKLLFGVIFVLAAMFVYSFRLKPVRFGLGVGALIALSGIFSLAATDDISHRERSFFGISKVKVSEAGDYTYLVHGSTVHGAQHVEQSKWTEKLTYFSNEGPVGQLFSSATPTRFQEIGVLGLGIGTISCYQTPGQRWTFFEIDPAILKIARDTRYFHYMDECAEKAEVILGDGRLSLNNVKDGHFDLLVMDAFASDSVPVHLITLEALDLYMSKISSEGVVLFNISNRYMDFSKVLTTLVKMS